jgi:hypothetical protein
MDQHICPVQECNQGKIVNSKTLAKDKCETCQGSGYITQEQYEIAVENFTGKKTTSVVDEYVVKNSADFYTESGKLTKQYDKIEDVLQTGDFITSTRNWDLFREGLAAVRLGDDKTGKWGFIDKAGKEVIPCKYDITSGFSDGLAAVRLGDGKTGKWGFIDKAGKEIVPPKYDFAMGFQLLPIDFDDLPRVRLYFDDRAIVRLNEKWGFIDKAGKEVIPCKYDLAKNFDSDLAQVRLNGKWGFIDKAGIWQGGPEPTASSGGCLWVVVFFTTLLTLACNY